MYTVRVPRQTGFAISFQKTFQVPGSSWSGATLYILQEQDQGGESQTKYVPHRIFVSSRPRPNMQIQPRMSSERLCGLIHFHSPTGHLRRNILLIRSVFGSRKAMQSEILTSLPSTDSFIVQMSIHDYIPLKVVIIFFLLGSFQHKEKMQI